MNYKLIEKQKVQFTTNPAIKAITKSGVTSVPALSDKNVDKQDIMYRMIIAVNQLDDIGISDYFDPINRTGYPMEFDKLYITLDPEKPLVMRVIEKLNIEIELDFDPDSDNWYDSGMFDIYIPDSPFYQVGKIFDIKNGVSACEITLNDGPAFAYYIYNKQSLVVGNWLHDKDYIDVVARKVWPKLLNKLYLTDKKFA